ncbi:hypothetical protein B566_EDAN004115 [Ephemera danica]|nr:hypothetical protein B566_EDAN004115 [Ephemera danica]
MQLASEITPSGMATVMYGPDSQLNFACKEAKEHCLQNDIEKPECAVANYLFPHCKVVAGNEMALEFLEKNAAKFKLRRVKRLPVSGAFHTELMRPALEPFRVALKKANVSEPLVTVHSNVNAAKYRDDQHIKRQLPSQICKPVRWEQTMHVLYERDQGQAFPRTFECGPGKSLRTILKQVNAKAWDSSFSVEV